MFKKGNRNVLFIDENDLMAVVKKIDDLQGLGECSNPTQIGNCGWANAPKCWFVRFYMTEDHRRVLLDYIVGNQIKTYDPNLIY